ncbi:juvenile hormone acid O-methyltransferase-like [Lutzomyia longipalpis]|uniref:juvenile hormone acid O-methyltransferase-like n=1 Tax=Lutzomyia longipalpis TaxID=7200 RepID=UPI0024846E48|nr:juvenile hormone acid O-methyltransferase-like [Lutzomyia longipalpis]
MSFVNAKAYKGGNEFSVKVTKNLMDEFSGWLNWRADGKDSVLDVGSGPGNTVRESIYPLLPPNFTRLVVSDISPQMVELQRKEFSGFERVSCEVLDIGSEISDEMKKKLSTFDHVTSFFCLQWVADQQRAMDNIYSLLKPGGDCFLAIVADTPVLNALISVCENPRWKDCFAGWQEFYGFPYTNITEAKCKGLEFMQKAGFTETRAELRYCPFKYANDEQKENFLRSIPNKFSREVSAEEEEEIFQERLQVFDQFNVGDYRDNTNKIEKPNTYLILYGKREKKPKI